MLAACCYNRFSISFLRDKMKELVLLDILFTFVRTQPMLEKLRLLHKLTILSNT